MSEPNVRTFHTPMRTLLFRQTFPTKPARPDPSNPVTSFDSAARHARRLDEPPPQPPPRTA